MGIDKGVPRKESIHDLDIENYNWIILQKARGLVQDCKDLGISFQVSENKVVLSVVRILQNVD